MQTDDAFGVTDANTNNKPRLASASDTGTGESYAGKSMYPTGPKGLVRPPTLHAATTFFVSPLLGAGKLRAFRTRQKQDRYAPPTLRKAALDKTKSRARKSNRS